MSPCFHRGRCPDCEEDFPCGACGAARVKNDGDWCQACAGALDEFLEEIHAAVEEVFGEWAG